MGRFIRGDANNFLVCFQQYTIQRESAAWMGYDIQRERYFYHSLYILKHIQHVILAGHSTIEASTNHFQIVFEEMIEIQFENPANHKLKISTVTVCLYCFLGSWTTEQFVRFGDISYDSEQKIIKFLIADAQRTFTKVQNIFLFLTYVIWQNTDGAG